MRRILSNGLKVVMSIVLAMGMTLSFSSQMVAHVSTDLTQIVADHYAEIEEHGHAHDDNIDVMMSAYHGHAHDVADHDHSTAFLIPHVSAGIVLPTSNNWAMANCAMPDRRDFDLYRPPCV